MRPLGILLIIAAIAFPLPYYLDLMPKYDSLAIFSLYLGSVALILMSISQLMATRFPGIQLIFGGLDRIYLLHKWVGIFAVSALMLHDVIDAEISNLGKETWLADIAEEGGEIALYGLLILGLFSLITFIPYELWKKTHKFLGAFFILSAFHFLYILKPFSLLDPLGLYITVSCIVGVVCYLYMLLFHGFIDRPKSYIVSAISSFHDVIEVTLMPSGKGINHKAGQFAFFHFNGEKHPFTIACGRTENREIKFCIKAIGNFTTSLRTQLKEGSTVGVSRPFGHFSLPNSKVQCWIAGGIGITPFLAWKEAIKEDQYTEIHLFYCIRSKGGDIPFVDQLNHPNIKLHLVDSAKGEHITVEQIKQELGLNFKNANYSFCGPKALRMALQKDLTLKYEEFEMRSGTKVPFLMVILKWIFSKALTYRRA